MIESDIATIKVAPATIPPLMPLMFGESTPLLAGSLVGVGEEEMPTTSID